MSLPYGSVNDLISAAGLVRTFISALREAQNAPLEYQIVIRELGNLETVLLEVRELSYLCRCLGGYEALAEQAQLQALKCRTLVAPYQKKITKYGKSLRVGGSDSSSKDRYWKFHWRVSHQEDLEEFRRSIRTQIEVMMAIMATAKM
jgi:hypothetical protein